jgi:hypothetical protein
MSNPSAVDVQVGVLKNIWEHYRAYTNTSVRLKTTQGRWRSWLLVASIIALLVTPFAKTFDKFHLDTVSSILTVVATVLFSLMAWFHREVLGDDSEQPWVRSRQTGEGLKSLAFRFLGGAKPFDTPGPEAALRRAEELRKEAAIAPDSVTAEQAQEKIPPAPLTMLDYVKLRVDDQIDFYSKAIDRVREANRRIVNISLAISAGVVVFGALGALIAKDWRDIWAPALGAAATLATAENTRARQRFLVDSYSTAMSKLEFAKTRWEVSAKQPEDDTQLIETTEGIVAAENAGWVQQMLLKPVVPDQPATGTTGTR